MVDRYYIPTERKYERPTYERPTGTGYEQYLATLREFNPNAPVVHRAVVDEVKACQSRALAEPNPSRRMLLQVECAKGIGSRMVSKGFIQIRKRRKAKYGYVQA